ncbi:MAG: 3-phosphoglycerate dehydrogenase [Clostridia bacterium]|nr:3-phosphoglycerate dehydrogenase [Clostridia bacterium]
MNILLKNNIAAVGLARLPESYSTGTDVSDPDGILVRSADLKSMAFGPSLKAIARAGAGVNNIPVSACTDAGIVIFNTPGANANGVKELVLCALILSSRGILQGSRWLEDYRPEDGPLPEAVEQGKKRFSGTEIKGKTLGVIGLGAIGGMVANDAVHLGMDVTGYDPFLSVDGAWNLSRHIRHAGSIEEVCASADYLTLHVPSTDDTRHMICADLIGKMKDGIRILNFARGDLVDDGDLAEALKSGKVASYVTDFPSERLLRLPGVLSIPHLGASTDASEDNCAVMAADELTDYLENGNIRNSVNYPSVHMPRSGDTRICILNDNIPDVISGVTSVLSSNGVNIENLTNKSRASVAYTVVDISGGLPSDAEDQLKRIRGVRRVRVI